MTTKKEIREEAFTELAIKLDAALEKNRSLEIRLKEKDPDRTMKKQSVEKSEKKETAIKDIKLTAEKEEDIEEEKEEEDIWECGACGHGGKGDFPAECPSCGVEFQ